MHHRRLDAPRDGICPEIAKHHLAELAWYTSGGLRKSGGEDNLSEGGGGPGLLARGCFFSGAPEVPGRGQGANQEPGGILSAKGSSGREGQAQTLNGRDAALTRERLRGAYVPQLFFKREEESWHQTARSHAHYNIKLLEWGSLPAREFAARYFCRLGTGM